MLTINAKKIIFCIRGTLVLNIDLNYKFFKNMYITFFSMLFPLFFAQV